MRALILIVPLVLLSSCNRSSDDSGTVSARETTPNAADQSNAQADLDHLAEIRKSIVGADGLSVAAQNVTVLTRSGDVTLRGTVPSAEERSRIEQLARACSQTHSVDNQLVVKAD